MLERSTSSKTSKKVKRSNERRLRSTNMFVYISLLVFCALQLFVVPRPSFAYEYLKCPKNWLKRGCRVNFHRDLIPIFDDRKPDAKVKIDWDDFSGYIEDLTCRCCSEAIKLKYTWFALENYGVCLSGTGPLQNYSATHPLDPENRCVGVLKLNASLVSDIDGELCVGGQYRAYFYDIKNSHIGGIDPGPIKEVTVAPPLKCSYVSDVILLVDVSGSVGKGNFKLVQEFLKKFITRYDFSSKGKSRLGIARFDEKCYIDLTWLDSDGISADRIREIINDMEYTAGSTLTDNALKCLKDKIITPFQRDGVPKTVVVLTDGNSWNGFERLPVPSRELRDMGCTMVAIGIGDDVDPNELKIITGSSKQVFLLASFRNLIDHAAAILNSLIAKVCRKNTI
ncbi:collagen alpha-1(XII) chain-like [Actinia tenebrosa]|uniref:Collagen alpha-1(XII) chain-like n=1 Tax=Actinia tenebrosa TaxID=6105 RepID=A0A6P8I206_ACTTE|nr:collagen alpha-1(XII) chain-like [Actinia tenebrosa]